MKKRQRPWVLMGPVLALVLLGIAGSAVAERGESTFGQPQISAVTGPARVLEDARVIDFGKVLYKGRVDVNSTLERIRAGKKLEHRNDGAIFRNREGRLPRRRDPDYYREFVHYFRGMPFPGPQRVIIGKKGEVYYSGDHYTTYTQVR